MQQYDTVDRAELIKTHKSNIGIDLKIRNKLALCISAETMSYTIMYKSEFPQFNRAYKEFEFLNARQHDFKR